MNLPAHITNRGTFCGVLILDDALTGRPITLSAGASDDQIMTAIHEHRRKWIEQPPEEEKRLDPAGVACVVIIGTFAAIGAIAAYFIFR